MTTVSPAFAINADPGGLYFRAAHFITLDDSRKSLHGHNFHIQFDARSNINADELVIDFAMLTRNAGEPEIAVEDADRHCLMQGAKT